MTSVDDAKAALRLRARETRRAAHRAASRDAAEAIRVQWREARAQGLIVPAGVPAAGYWPVRDEMDVRALLQDLAADGVDTALPVVEGADRPLAFRRWRPGVVLTAGGWGLSEPPPTAPLLRPFVLIVPLLAFDGRGYRLGMGRGYYDRTLRTLRAGGPLLTVGLAFAAQEVPEVPHDGFDERLDWIVTEREARRFAG